MSEAHHWPSQRLHNSTCKLSVPDGTISVEMLSPRSIVDKAGQGKRLQRKSDVGRGDPLSCDIAHRMLVAMTGKPSLVFSDYVLFILLLPIL